jgi:hypothetical protein
MGVGGKLEIWASLTPGNKCSACFIGGRVGPRVG